MLNSSIEILYSPNGLAANPPQANGIVLPPLIVSPESRPFLHYADSILKWYRGGMQDWCSLGLTVV